MNKFSRLKKKLNYCEDVNELIDEHKRVVDVLGHPKEDKLKKEKDIQSKELRKYKKYATQKGV